MCICVCLCAFFVFFLIFFVLGVWKCCGGFVVFGGEQHSPNGRTKIMAFSVQFSSLQSVPTGLAKARGRRTQGHEPPQSFGHRPSKQRNKRHPTLCLSCDASECNVPVATPPSATRGTLVIPCCQLPVWVYGRSVVFSAVI